MDPLSLLTLPLPLARPSLPLRTSARPPNTAGRASPYAARLAPARQWRRQRARLSSQVSAVAAEAPPSPSPSGGGEEDSEGQFDWLDQWYPFAPVCDLDPGAPHGKTVLGLRVVAWYDRAVDEWRVFDDKCPHRLAPLSEGRIDDKGRLQCVYHGWCFDGRGSCQFIPQAPALGPPVHKNSKACVASYPSVVQNNILWFYPRADAEHQDVLDRKRPPFIPEIDDPSFVTVYGIRDLSYGYDVLVENLMDPAHVPYAHKGLMGKLRKKEDPGRVEFDIEGGGPMKIKIEEADVNGFLSSQENGYFRYEAPCTFYGSPLAKEAEGEEAWSTICASYSSQSTARYMAIRGKLQEVKKLDSTMTDYFNKVKGLSDTLTSIGQPLRDEEFISYLLAGLDDDYEGIVDVISNRTTPMPLKDLFAQLCNKEQRVEAKKAELQGSQQLHPAMNVSKGGGKAPYRGDYRPDPRMQSRQGSYSGGGSGSSNRGGYSGGGNGSSNRGGYTPGGGGNRPRQDGQYHDNNGGRYGGGNRPICQICDKVGHTASSCFKRFKTDFLGSNNDGRYMDRQVAAATTHGRGGGGQTSSYNVDPGWYMDTGATDHLTNHLDKLTVKENYNGTDQVHAANGNGPAHEGHSS